MIGSSSSPFANPTLQNTTAASPRKWRLKSCSTYTILCPQMSQCSECTIWFVNMRNCTCHSFNLIKTICSVAFQYHYIRFSNQDHKLYIVNYKSDLVQVFIDTIRTFQYQDRITFTCKVCGFLGESRAQVQIAKPLLCQTQTHVIKFFWYSALNPNSARCPIMFLSCTSSQDVVLKIGTWSLTTLRVMGASLLGSFLRCSWEALAG